MKAKTGISLFLLLAVLMTGCGGRPEATFEISGSPNPLFYGGTCGASVMTFTVMGPGAGLEIKSIIAAYQLFDSAGKKVREDTLHLNPVPGATPVTYDATRIIIVPDSGGSSPAPDEPLVIFGEGHIDFAATVYAKILVPAPTGPEETFYFTSTKSIPVLPCAPTPTVPPPPPAPTKKPKGEPPPPSCSIEPNNPNCVP